MFLSTLPHLRCPSRHSRSRSHSCGGLLSLEDTEAPHKDSDIRFGIIRCIQCQSRYPILAGVAILVEDIPSYFWAHIKGISAQVDSSEVPRQWRKDFQEARRELRAHEQDIGDEEDLEARRVITLYALNHYLRAQGNADTKSAHRWWGTERTLDPLLDSLIRAHWDRGPHARIFEWLSKRPNLGSVLELGCSVGGLVDLLDGRSGRYLGLDSSFASVAMGRHLAFGAHYTGSLKIPQDLINGQLTLPLPFRPHSRNGEADLIVADALNPPVPKESFDVCLALNLIDMLDEPADLPKVQSQVLKHQGKVIQGSPYIWSESSALKLRKTGLQTPTAPLDSASVVEALYLQAGFDLEKAERHLPWLFYKHFRQLEIYSVHLFLGIKN